MIPPAPPGPACSVVCPSRVRGSILPGAKSPPPAPVLVHQYTSTGAALDRQPRSQRAEEKRRNFPGTPHNRCVERRGGQGGTPCKTHQPAPPSGGGSARTMARRQRGADVHISFPLAAKPQDGAEWRQSSSPAPAGQGGDFRPGRKYYPVLDCHQARAARRKDRLTVRTGESARGERPRLFGGLFPPDPQTDTE